MLLLVLPLLLATSWAGREGPGARLVNQTDMPLSTKESIIVDTHGDRVKWACVNWYGPHLPDTNVVGGLHRQPLAYMVDWLVDNGFNCVRLPFSVHMWHDDPPVPAHSALPVPVLAANPQFENYTALEVFDAVVDALTARGMMVILNVHTSASGWCCHLDSDEGLWFTPEWPVETWKACVTAMTQRYLYNPLVVAFDLRNEIHDVAPRDLHVGWGQGPADLDWVAVATEVGNSVLDINPDMLIVVTALCFGQDLRPCKRETVQLSLPNRLVWTAHWYSWYGSGYFEYPAHVGVEHYLTLAVIYGCLTAVLVAGLTVLQVTWAKGWAVRPTRAQQGKALVWSYTVVLLLPAVACIIAGQTLKKYCEASYWASGIPVAPYVMLAAGLLPSCVLIATRLRRCSSRSWPGTKRTAVDGTDQQDGPQSSASKTSGCHLDRECVRACCCGAPCCAALLGGLAFTVPGLVWCLLATTPMIFSADVNAMWGFVVKEGEPYTAPLWIGEFGTGTRNAYWLNMIQYLHDQDLDWSYWAYYGPWRCETVDGHDTCVPETYGLVSWNYRNGAFATEESGWADSSDWRLQDLYTIQRSPPEPLIGGTAPDGMWSFASR